MPFENRKPGLTVNVYVLPSRDDREARATSGVATAPAARFLVLPVHQLARRRGLELPRLPVVGELRVDVVHVGRDLHHDRAAALCARRGRGDRGGELGRHEIVSRIPSSRLVVIALLSGRGPCPVEPSRRLIGAPGSETPRRPSPSRLKASVVKSGAGQATTMSSGRGVAQPRPRAGSPSSRSEAGSRARGRRSRLGQDERGDVERREDDHRADEVREDVRADDPAARRPDHPRRLHELLLAINSATLRITRAE